MATSGLANEATGALGKVHPSWDDSPIHVEDVGCVLYVRPIGINTELLCRGPRTGQGRD